MSPMMKRLSLLVSFVGWMAGCGDGDFRVNPAAGTLSTVGGSGPSTNTAQAYFTANIFPIMTATTGGKGCLGSGCHSPSSDQTFFQLDASSASISYNWAGIRRTQAPDPGTYASASSARILTKKDTVPAHNSFSNWTTADKAFIDTWSSMSE